MSLKIKRLGLVGLTCTRYKVRTHWKGFTRRCSSIFYIMYSQITIGRAILVMPTNPRPYEFEHFIVGGIFLTSQ